MYNFFARIRPYRWLIVATTFLFFVAFSNFTTVFSAPTVIATIPVGTSPFEGDVNTDTNRVYISNRNSNNVTVINGTTNTVISTIPVGNTAQCVRVDKVHNWVYVCNFYGNSISIIDGANNTVINTVSVPSSPSGIAINYKDNRYYVSQYWNDSVLVMDLTTNNLITTIQNVGSGPGFNAYNPNTNRLYVTNQLSGNFTIIDTTNNTIKTTLPLGGGLTAGVDVNLNTNRVYLAGYGGNVLVVLNSLTDTVITTVPMSTSPNVVKVNPVTNKIYISMGGSSSLTELDGATNTISGTSSVGSGPTALAVNPLTKRIYVGNFNDNNVSVLSITPVPGITKAFGTASLPLATNTSLTFTLTNPDADNSFSGLAFSDNLPAGLVVATPNNLSTTCSGSITAVAASSSITYSGGSLAGGANCSISIDVKGTSLGVKNNQTGPLSTTETGNLSPSNVATLSVTGPASDIRVQKTVNNNQPLIGASITFTVTVSNLGPDNNTGVKVSDVLPNGLDFVSANPAAGTYNSNTGIWDIGNLNNGQNVVLTLVTTVTQTAPQTNTASVTAQNVPDQDTTNNIASSTIQAQGSGIVVTKPTDDGQGTLTGSLSWAITQANSGNIKTIIFADNINSVQMTDGILPEVASGVYIQGRCSNGPSFTINGGNRVGNGFVIKGRVTLYGLKVTNFNGIQIKASTENGKNTLVCIKASRYP